MDLVADPSYHLRPQIREAGDTRALWLPGYNLSEPHRLHWLDRGVLKWAPVIPRVEEASFCAPLPKPGFLVPPSTHL